LGQTQTDSINRIILISKWTRHIHQVKKRNLVLVNLVQFDSINQLIPLTVIPLSDAHCMYLFSKDKIHFFLNVTKLSYSNFIFRFLRFETEKCLKSILWVLPPFIYLRISSNIFVLILRILHYVGNHSEAGVTFDNSFFDNYFDLVRQLKNGSFLGPVLVHVTGQTKN